MNSISVSFSGYKHTAEAARALWQWDYGQRLTISGLSLPNAYEVHFCNAGDQETITVIGSADGVQIPDEVLETGRHIKAYIYLHDGDDDGETEYEVTIRVNPRAKPTGRTPKSTELSVLDYILVMLNSLTFDGEGENTSANGISYTSLINRPRINGIVLTGDQTGSQIGLVDAVEGMGLSTNDFTDADKEKLSHAASVNDLESAMSSVQSSLSFDNTPTENSDNPVTSDGVYCAISSAVEPLSAFSDKDFDQTPTENSVNAVTSDGIYRAIYALSERIATLERTVELLSAGLNTGSSAAVDDDILVLSGTGVEVDQDEYLVINNATVDDGYLVLNASNESQNAESASVDDSGYLVIDDSNASIVDGYLVADASISGDLIQF